MILWKVVYIDCKSCNSWAKTNPLAVALITSPTHDAPLHPRHAPHHQESATNDKHTSHIKRESVKIPYVFEWMWSVSGCTARQSPAICMGWSHITAVSCRDAFSFSDVEFLILTRVCGVMPCMALDSIRFYRTSGLQMFPSSMIWSLLFVTQYSKRRILKKETIVLPFKKPVLWLTLENEWFLAT